jgi:hypothetical protein
VLQPQPVAVWSQPVHALCAGDEFFDLGQLAAGEVL